MKEPRLPTLKELGDDLTRITLGQRLWTVAVPFLCVIAYFAFAGRGWWPPAVVALMYLSFVTYGSTSHDLVHRNLGFRPAVNDALLSAIELLALRSGRAYRAAHLHHHARYPHEDDIEGAAARMTLGGALREGIVFQVKIWLWAARCAKRGRGWVLAEGVACTTLIALAVVSVQTTPVFCVYVVLMVMGSWIIPLITSYIPHTPYGGSPLFQTRAFRGRVASVVALEHLYHLEHHLYPAVPHHNWPRLAKRLDPYLHRAGVRPVTLGF